MKFSKKIKFPKILIVFLLILVFLVGCNTKSSGTQIPISTFLDQDKNEIVTKIESLSERDRLDTQYRQTNYVAGYEEVTKRLNKELNDLFAEILPDLLDYDYLYKGEIVLSNVGYNETQINNYTLREVLSNHEDWIISLELIGLLFIDDYSKFAVDDDLYEYHKSIVPLEKVRNIQTLVNEKLSVKIKFLDKLLLKNYKKSLNIYLENYINEYIYFIYLDDSLKKGIGRNQKAILNYLNNKYDEKFIYTGLEYRSTLESNIHTYAPLWDLSMTFEAESNSTQSRDLYTKVAYQHILGGHIEEVIKKYNAEDKIGYFIAVESNQGSSKEELISLRKGLEGLKELSKTCEISLYYVKSYDDEEDKELISKIINDIYEPTNDDAIVLTFTYVYSLEEEDRKIFLKMLDKDKFSENYLERINSSDTWADTMTRTRNNSDSFKFLDVFGEKSPYVYVVAGALSDKINKGGLEKFKQKNKYGK